MRPCQSPLMPALKWRSKFACARFRPPRFAPLCTGPEGFRVERMTLANPDTRLLRSMAVDADGAASMTDLDEGRYIISATATAGSETLAAYQLIIVGTGEYDVPMYLQPTATVTGRVVAERGGVPPIGGVIVEAHWVASGNTKLDLTGPERVAIAPDGSFSMTRALRPAPGAVVRPAGRVARHRRACRPVRCHLRHRTRTRLDDGNHHHRLAVSDLV